MASIAPSGSFAVKGMILAGWPVLSILLICSILSLAVVWDRWLAFRRVRKNISKTLEQIASRIRETSHLEEKERVAHYEIMRCTSPLEARLPILGTIASTTPFIGLLGTVIGIIRAFRAVSVSMGGGPAVVANGIAEALVTTAAGLMVAIPAVIFHNYFARKLQHVEQQLWLSAGDLISGIKK